MLRTDLDRLNRSVVLTNDILRRWRRIATDPTVPPIVREVYRRGADRVERVAVLLSIEINELEKEAIDHPVDVCPDCEKVPCACVYSRGGEKLPT